MQVWTLPFVRRPILRVNPCHAAIAVPHALSPACCRGSYVVVYAGRLPAVISTHALIGHGRSPIVGAVLSACVFVIVQCRSRETFSVPIGIQVSNFSTSICIYILAFRLLSVVGIAY